MDYEEIKESLAKYLNGLDEPERIAAINEVRAVIHDYSPFKSEPVDYVRWVNMGDVEANNYNPNTVAPPEMSLLEHSITEDGYTQPIVVFFDGAKYEVVDGFHRNRVGKESLVVQSRVKGFLPVTIIREDRDGRNNRIASTIRHNRARGKHSVDGMAEIVVELKKRNWSNKKIGKELGMDPDEILRLSQITGLAEMFSDRSFSEAWEAVIDSSINEDDDLNLSGEVIG